MGGDCSGPPGDNLLASQPISSTAQSFRGNETRSSMSARAVRRLDEDHTDEALIFFPLCCWYLRPLPWD